MFIHRTTLMTKIKTPHSSIVTSGFKKEKIKTEKPTKALLGSYQKDFDILAKIRYNPLSIISLKDDFFRMVERFSNVFVDRIVYIQNKLHSDTEAEYARLSTRTISQEKMLQTSEDADIDVVLKQQLDENRKQNYTIPLEDKLYYANLFGFANELYFDYISEILVKLARENHPIYLELYIRLIMHRSDWDVTYKASLSNLYKALE